MFRFASLLLLVAFTRLDHSPVYFNPAMIVGVARGVQCHVDAPTRIVTLAGESCVRESVEDAVKKIEAVK